MAGRNGSCGSIIDIFDKSLVAVHPVKPSGAVFTEGKRLRFAPSVATAANEG